MKNFAFILLISMFFTSCSLLNDNKSETSSEEDTQTEITQSGSIEIEENQDENIDSENTEENENSQETSTGEIMIENESENNSNT
jgi:PBP1b-binding outer membrane lipoprotein LpoB